MLFDLRGRGRRRTIQAIYLTLAVLMGGGLVFFGIGGNTSGGLFDAFKGNGGGGSGTSVFAKQIKTAERQVKVNPNDTAAWAALAKARFGDAGQGKNYDRTNQTYTDDGRKELQGATDAFKRYLLLNKGKADLTLASQALQAILAGGLNDPVTGTTAARIVAEARPSANTYYQLAQLAYKAGDKRTGDLASSKTLELAPPGRKSQVKLLLEQAKNPSASNGSPAAGAGSSSTP
jgi:hypothetical protein